MAPVRKPKKTNKEKGIRKASEQASSSPVATKNGKEPKKVMLTPKNKLCDSISATFGERKHIA